MMIGKKQCNRKRSLLVGSEVNFDVVDDKIEPLRESSLCNTLIRLSGQENWED